MPQNGNFENWPVSRKALPVQRKKAQFQPPGVEREYMNNLWNFGQWPSFMPNMTILKISQYLGNCCEYMLNFDPLG